MTTAFVADASTAIGWVHPAQASRDTEAMLDALAAGASLHVPALWPLEVANALLALTRRRKLTDEDRRTALRWLRGLRVRVDDEASSLAFSELSESAARYNLSIYDATYLELARRHRLPLGCKDGPLRAAARRAGVHLFE